MIDQTESALLSNIKTLKTEKSAHHQSLSKKRKRLFDMTTSTTTRNKSYAVTNENDSDDSSSDNDPPFWRNAAGHGGYFTKQSTVIKVNEDGNVELRDNANLRYGKFIYVYNVCVCSIDDICTQIKAFRHLH